jgi:hypothetical protein
VADALLLGRGGHGATPSFALAEPVRVVAGIGGELGGHPPDTAITIGDTSIMDGVVAHNLNAPRLLPDPRLGEVLIAASATDTLLVRLPAGRPAGPSGLGDRFDEAWRHLVGLFGALPWPVPVVIGAGHEWPRAMSFPGAILLSPAMTPVGARTVWLYLVHELIHQWFGNLARIGEDDLPTWEAGLDAIAWVVAEQVLGPEVTSVFTATYERYLGSTAELRRRGELVLEIRGGMPADVARTPLPGLAAEAAAAVTGSSRLVLPPLDRVLRMHGGR